MKKNKNIEKSEKNEKKPKRIRNGKEEKERQKEQKKEAKEKSKKRRKTRGYIKQLEEEENSPKYVKDGKYFKIKSNYGEEVMVKIPTEFNDRSVWVQSDMTNYFIEKQIQNYSEKFRIMRSFDFNFIDRSYVIENLQQDLPCILPCFSNSHWYFMIFMKQMEEMLCFIIDSFNGEAKDHSAEMIEKIKSLTGIEINSQFVDVERQPNCCECGFRMLYHIAQFLSSNLDDFINNPSSIFALDRAYFEYVFIPSFLRSCLLHDCLPDSFIIH